MFISEYISKDYPIFSVEDTIPDAENLVRDFGFTHIFVQKQGVFLGALSQNFLEENPQEILGNLEIHLEKFAIKEDAHLIDAVQLFYTYNSNIVPVIGEFQEYLGYIAYDDIFNELSKYPLFSENGALMVIQTTHLHYSLAEVTQIVEASNEKLYGCFLSSVQEDSVQITLKTSSRNLSSLEETFQRYGYLIVHRHYNNEKEELIKDRFKFLEKYLEI